VRDPAATATEVEAALAEARDHLGLLKRLGFLEPGVEGLEAHTRWRARVALRLPARKWPADVRDYLLRVLSEKPTPTPMKGRPSTEFRDYWLRQVIACLVAVHDLTATRNRSPSNNSTPRQQQPTACEMVAEELAELGIDLTEASVEAIWSQRLRPGDAFDHMVPEYRARAEAWIANAEVGATIRTLAYIEAQLAILTVREK
jgi:hypothetical protein